MFFSKPVSNKIFLPSHPQRLPPNVKVIKIRAKRQPLTFHLLCNFFSMLQKCSKSL